MYIFQTFYGIIFIKGNMMNDKEITELFGIPKATLDTWKKTEKDNWRFNVYNFLKNQDKVMTKFKMDLIKKELNQ